MKLQVVKGMRDLSGPEARAFSYLEAEARRIFGLYGFEELRTPLMEFVELFTKGIGEETDIVGKEMYLLEDRKGQKLALRPEGTASVVRHVAVSQVLKQKKQAKYFYMGPMFRYERPQKGRFRQFHQIGVESFGVEGPDADLEMFLMLRQYFAAIELTDVSFQINSIGCQDPGCRPTFKQKLVEYLSAHKEALCEDCNRRMETNPLRVLDCKVPGCIEVTQSAPKAIDWLCEPCDSHFKELTALLEDNGIQFELNHRLVRGLDYYSRTVFEVYSANLGAQSAAGGGGRFDGLFEQYGQESVPSIGFALGLDRLALLAPEPPAGEAPVFVIGFERAATVKLVAAVRNAGKGCFYDPGFASMKSQFKQADKAGARFVMILGEEEVKSGQVALKDLSTGEQDRVDIATALARVTEA
ncbi:MAG: histidine--tRNA ligase [bacterium]|nr:histidine--tRNA ligase [bacterium]